VSRMNQWYLVPDVNATATSRESFFTFLDGRGQIASIAAFPIHCGGKCDVLCIDTDCNGFFDEEKLRRIFDIRDLHQQFEKRLQLEWSLVPYTNGRSSRRSDHAVPS
jgi:hypothetical protein